MSNEVVSKVRQRSQDTLFRRKLARSGVQVGENASVAPGSRFPPGSTIGRFTNINGAATVHGPNPLRVGGYCAIGMGLHAVTFNHDMSRPGVQLDMYRRFGFTKPPVSDDPTTVGHAVWVGDRVTLLPGVTVGDGAVIGAGSVVTKDVQPFAVVAGVPAKAIRRRFSDEMVDFLLATAWWHWPTERIARNRAFFEADLTTLDVAAAQALVVP